MLKLSKTSSPQKLFDYDCVTLYLGYVLNGSGLHVPPVGPHDDEHDQVVQQVRDRDPIL